jgi:hypothetical protein
MGYAYTPEGLAVQDAIPVLAQDLIHVKLPNPLDEYEGQGFGLSPLSALATAGDVDNAISDFIKKFFEQGAMITGLVKSKVPLNEQDIERIRTRWREVYGGKDNWNVAVLGEDVDFQSVGMTFNEMKFEALDERNEARICAPFGVPPILIGTLVGLKHATYSNYEQARQAFWQDTLVPELQLFEDEYRYYLQTDTGGFVKFDLSRVPALQEDIPNQVNAWAVLVDRGIPAEQAALTVGLSLAHLPETTTEIEMEPDTEPETTPEAEPDDVDMVGAPEAEAAAAADDETKSVDWSAEDKQTIWARKDALAVDHEAAFGAAAREAFEHDKRSLLALLHEHKSLTLAQKQTINWTAISTSWTAYLQSKGQQYWQQSFLPAVQGLIQDAAEQWAVELNMSFDAIPLMAVDWYSDYILQFAQPINETTQEALTHLLQQATHEGWSIETMQNRITEVFEQFMAGGLTPEEFAWFEARMPPYRTEMIARTETIRALNGGSLQLFKDWAVAQKEWLATEDHRTRPTHSIANGQVRGIDQPFSVGGYQMMYPGDAMLGAPPEEFVNCRCALLPVMA